ncbi:RPP1B [Candida metapsilosis]|uniref:RPP1B n=1 Tax=Candida metapsilosis TaxID=273372 RepID=A0A8H7ZF88_9ASCO|nr:RPP1B [Candida metapsilosis]
MSSESSISYAALILADAEQEITSDKLLAITKAAGAQVDSIWADVFAKALEGKDLKELLFSFAAAAPAGAAAAGGASAAAGGDAAAAPAEEAAEEEKEESDDDMGFGLFD